jgi:hypothetical protein
LIAGDFAESCQAVDDGWVAGCIARRESPADFGEVFFESEVFPCGDDVVAHAFGDV